MKYPNPTFLTKASEVRKTRHTRTIILIAVLVILTLSIIFVSHIASMQEIYRQEFPDLVGAGTSTTTTTEETTEETESSSETEETTEESTEETTTVPAPIIHQDDTEPSDTDPAETTAQNNSPDAFVESDDVAFNTTRSLQTVSHEERDIMLDRLKQEITDYINANPGERFAVRYVNLLSNETLGINDLEPIIPAGAFTMPIEIACWEMIGDGLLSTSRTFTYDGNVPSGSSSYICDTYTAGKQFFLRTCLNYAIAKNDNLALQYVIDAMGGIDNAWTSVSRISSYINYRDSVIYTDYTGMQQRGPSRTSAYDLANYAEYLYNGYLNDPDTYRQLINDMAQSEITTGTLLPFTDSGTVLHSAGRNIQMHAYTDVAIIDVSEPIVVVIYCECSSLDRANTIQADIATYIARFINDCHS